MTMNLPELLKIAEAEDQYEWKNITNTDSFKQSFTPRVAIELIKRLQEAEKDAARYAYLRKTTKAIRDDEGKERIEVTPEEFDDAIDAAMNGGKK